MLTISELRSMLDDMAYESPLGEETEVRFASQPSWPFEYSIEGGEVVNLDEETCEDCEGNGYDFEDKLCQNCNGSGVIENGESENFVAYLVEGRQIGYLPGIVASKIGW